MNEQKVSIIIPTLNEEGNVHNLVRRIDEALRPHNIGYELIFIDDNSSDKTFETTNSLIGHYPIRSYLKQGKGGKGYSIVEGFEYVTSELTAIIDSDLEYPPEAIPEMIAKITEGKADFVIGDRDDHKVNFLRQILSTGFTLFFGRILHGLKGDVQSGLKVFRTQIIREVKINPSPWAWDLELMTGARDAGYKLGWVKIILSERTFGKSTHGIFKVAKELAFNALRLKLRRKKLIIIQPTGPNMTGAGVAKNGSRFITHSSLDPKISAHQAFVLSQKLFIVSIIVLLSAGFYFYSLTSTIVIMAILSGIYFADVLFNLFLVLKSLGRPPELKFNDHQISQLDNTDLPTYSILCPLYRESRVLPGFIKAIENLDWPKDKLDVLLLLEENDKDTIDTAKSMDLPNYVRTIIVPHSMPKTKPKACNYGLSLARGEYLVIYDAEDQPETSQLKKAYLGFQKISSDIKCLQAKLNYFNPEQNLLTRLFTSEYSLWFDVTLPGLQSINTSIPLGGTSNHFRTKDLIDLKGWDPFNVTEDCDLGIRLFKAGYKTAILDSTTLEEANSNFKNWIRQRSRWIKGYMQTYLVHMRNPFEFFKKSPLHFMFFQFNVGGKIAFMLINPILWVTTILYFVLRPTLGPIIEQFYPSAVLYIAVFSLVFGNFLYLYYYMIGCAKREQWYLIKFVFLVPFYWLSMSVAALMALYELIVKPHYWQKTNHGLHLAKVGSMNEEKNLASTLIPEPVILATKNPLWHKLVPGFLLKNSEVAHGGILIVAMMVANLFNFLFNAYLGNKLSLENLGLVTLINTLWYVAAIFINSVSSTVNHRTAYLSAREGAHAGINFWKITLRLGIIVALMASTIWLVAVPLLGRFFQVQDIIILFLFTPALLFGVIASANRGFLQGNMLFQWTALITIIEACSKLIFAFMFVGLDLKYWVFASIPMSILTVALITLPLSRKLAKQLSNGSITPKTSYQFPSMFYAASIMSGISSAVFLSMDIILVKHYLDPSTAGAYALLALVGKMIYFFGSLPAVFMITMVSRTEGLSKDPRKVFYAIFGTTLGLVAIGFTGLGWFGNLFVPILLGERSAMIIEYLRNYALAISLFTLSNVIISYHLAKKQYIFPATSLILSGLMIAGFMVSHSSIDDVVEIISAVSLFGFSVITLMHIFETRLNFVSANLHDFIDAFIRPSRSIHPIGDGKRVLILNWRDIKHVFAGGAEVYIHEIAKRMVDRGDQVTIFCGNDGNSPRNETIDGVKIIRRGGFYFVYPWAFLYYFTQFRGQYDIIIDGHNGIPFFTPVYVKEPVVCIVHHIHQEVFRHSLPMPLAAFACFLERDLMPIVYRNIHFITVSPSSKKEMMGYGLVGKGIEIVYNGVDLKTFKPLAKNPTPVILYLGRLKAYKSIDILLTAFSILRKKVPDASLIIAGSGEEDNHLKRLSRQLGISDGIVFTGRISDEMKIQLLQKAWVMVNPSFMEGWGITTIEANACGTPVVGANVAGLRDSIKDFKTGYLVPHGDSEGFAQRILAIIEDRKLREELSRQSVQWASNFEWSKSTDNLMAIINGNKTI